MKNIKAFLGMVLLLSIIWKLTPNVFTANLTPILMYHYISTNPNPKDLARNTLSVTPDKFDEQMKYLSSRGFTPITLDTLYGIYNKKVDPPLKPIVLTFDDGYADFYSNAFPILKKYNFHVVVFLIIDKVGSDYYMSWDQIKEIHSSGLVTFESHAVSHTNLTTLKSDKLTNQLKNSKQMIESKTGYVVNFISYPYGISNITVRQMAQKAGYLGGVGTWFGKASDPSYHLPRIRITGQMSLLDFASRVN